MKKFATLVFAIAALSANGMASTFSLNCTAFPIQFSGSVGSGTVSCPGFAGAPAGEFLSGASLSLVADYTFGTAASNDIKLTFTIGAPVGVTWASSSVAIDVLGGFNSSSTSPAIPRTVNATGGITAGNFASAFNVGIASSVVSGGAGTSSAGATIIYTTSSLTPEPGSIALLGSGLAGLAVLGRKRLVRK